MKRSSPEAVQFLLESSLTLAEVEETGFRVDMKYLNRTADKLKRKIAFLHRKMMKTRVWRKWIEVHRKPNIGSRAQLGTVLFKHLGFKPKSYTDKSYNDAGELKQDARESTNKAALDHIDIPFVKWFLKAENLKKTLGTYVEGLQREAVKHADGRYYVHAIFNLNTASSFRSSEQLPNLQNQPKRNEEMANFVRRAFLPHPGEQLVDFDYKTLEVFVGQFYHKDPMMKKYLTDPKTDMHRDAAADLFMFPMDMMLQHAKEFKKSIRDSAKNMFVFPEFYGSVYFQCSKNIWEAMLRKKWTIPGTKVKVKKGVYREKLVREHLKDKGITKLGKCDPEYDAEPGTFEHHVKQVEKKLWKRFAGYARWKKDYYQEYLDRGYFEYLNGFVINVPHKRNDVTNYPIQGSAYHCLQWSMNLVNKELRRLKLKARAVNQIHDSMTLSVPPNELQQVIDIVVDIMTVRLRKHWKWITLPLEVEVEVAEVNKPWNSQKLWTKQGDEWKLKV